MLNKLMSAVVVIADMDIISVILLIDFIDIDISSSSSGMLKLLIDILMLMEEIIVVDRDFSLLSNDDMLKLISDIISVVVVMLFMDDDDIIDITSVITVSSVVTSYTHHNRTLLPDKVDIISSSVPVVKMTFSPLSIHPLLDVLGVGGML
jgi:hypothetical protein